MAPITGSDVEKAQGTKWAGMVIFRLK